MPTDRDDDPPLYAALLAELRARDEPSRPTRHRGDGYGPAGGGEHRWRDDDTGGVVVGRHHDEDGNGRADQADLEHADTGDHDFVDELGGRHLDLGDFEPEHAYEFPDPGWRPDSDFTGEWVGQHATRLASLPRGAAAPNGPTATTLRAAMGADLPLGAHPTLVADFNAALLAANATTVRRAAMFCAQIGHESLGLRYFAELWGPTAQQRRYEPVTSLSKQLGNTAPGDGYRYRGRGPIQLTGKGGFATFLAWCRAQGYRPPDLLADPDQVATSRWGFLAASHYWTVRRPGLNPASDRGSVEEATRLVNGGTYGLEDRRRRYQACLRLGAALLPVAAAPPAPPRPRKVLDMPERAFGPGDSGHRIVAPTGAASGIVAKSWLSASVDGSALIEVWAQRAGDSAPVGAGKDDVAHRVWNLGPGHRPWLELPSGTEFVTVHVKHSTGPGSLLVEQAPK